MQFLVTIHRPRGYDPALEDEAMGRAISALNRDMVAAGIRVFVGGLQSPKQAVSLRPQDDDSLLTREGPYHETPDYVGGLWVLDLDTLDEALEWGRKAALACRSGVEVRPFH